MRAIGCCLLAAGLFLSAASASATTINLSTVSSDGTPASQLDASLDFSVAGTTLTLTVTNTGTDFDINQVYFNGSGIVSSLSLTSATHSVAGNVTTAWAPVETGSAADGFGTFDFALTDGVGATNPDILNPGESIVFVLAITGSGPFSDTDFIVGNSNGYLAAAKFVNGPPDPECAGVIFPTEQCPEGEETEDSAFGTVPEPSSALLLGLGAAGLWLAGRKRS